MQLFVHEQIHNKNGHQDCALISLDFGYNSIMNWNIVELFGEKHSEKSV